MGLIITIIDTIVTVFTLTLIVYTLLRFFLDPYHPILNALGQVFEPLLAPIRARIPSMGGLDFSPLILIIGLQILGMILSGLLGSF
ncbi:MAG: YggT family protein [Brevefilum sp.]|nr:YggT family protein [Brevefilum sp.]